MAARCRYSPQLSFWRSEASAVENDVADTNMPAGNFSFQNVGSCLTSTSHNHSHGVVRSRTRTLVIHKYKYSECGSPLPSSGVLVSSHHVA